VIDKRVYYISGIDSRGAALYHRLFREESRKSAKVSGAELQTGKLNRVNDIVSAWDFSARFGETTSNVDYRFLQWDDVARALWIASTLKLIWIAIPYYISHYQYQVFKKFKLAGKGPYYSSISPVLYLLAAIVVSLILAMLGFKATGLLIQSLAASMLIGIVVFLSAMTAALRLGDKIGIWWVLQTIIFMARYGEKPIPALEAKLDAFADTVIAEHLAAPEQEVMLLGHCIGTMLSVSLLSRLIQRAPASLNNKLCLVTMGQCIPYLSYIPTALHFKQDLQRVVDDPRFPWVDYAARIDTFCFADVSPALADGVGAGLVNRPIRRLVRLFNMFSAEKYIQLKKNKRRIHLQYLMATDIKTDYDFFEIISQPNAELTRD
jgi:hypothetical protein